MTAAVPVTADPAARGTAPASGARGVSGATTEGSHGGFRPDPFENYPRSSETGSLRRRTRAAVGLVVIALALGVALAGTVAVVVWAIAVAAHHAASS